MRSSARERRISYLECRQKSPIKINIKSTARSITKTFTADHVRLTCSKHETLSLHRRVPLSSQSYWKVAFHALLSSDPVSRPAASPRSLVWLCVSVVCVHVLVRVCVWTVRSLPVRYCASSFFVWLLFCMYFIIQYTFKIPFNTELNWVDNHKALNNDYRRFCSSAAANRWGEGEKCVCVLGGGGGGGQTPSTGLWHPSFEGAGKPCSECENEGGGSKARLHYTAIWSIILLLKTYTTHAYWMQEHISLKACFHASTHT